MSGIKIIEKKEEAMSGLTTSDLQAGNGIEKLYSFSGEVVLNLEDCR